MGVGLALIVAWNAARADSVGRFFASTILTVALIAVGAWSVIIWQTVFTSRYGRD